MGLPRHRPAPHGYALHRDPRLFPHPIRFDPDRPHHTLLPPAFIPFGAGGRKRIGDTYAVTESVITLATVLARWHLAPVAHHTPKPSPSGMPHPDHLPMTPHARCPARLRR
ncbi:cytochrome P450 [Streptomyces sp. O3]